MKDEAFYSFGSKIIRTYELRTFASVKKYYGKLMCHAVVDIDTCLHFAVLLPSAGSIASPIRDKVVVRISKIIFPIKKYDRCDTGMCRPSDGPYQEGEGPLPR